MVAGGMAAVVLTFMMSEIPESERECLALNAYHEARDQSRLGMIGVSQVVLNRVEDDRFPNTICDVVQQQRFNDPPNAPIRIGQCQFSWYCDGKSDDPRDEYAYDTAMQTAAHAYYLYDIGYDITEGSTHYHATSVTPSWASSKQHVVDIDDHRFYRWE